MTKPTLLLVDDEERILRSLHVLFSKNYTVRMTTDAHAALRILREERVHVIVSDQRMPMMLGADLLRQACEISPMTMRVLLTGYADLDASLACVNEGRVFRYLLKPWSSEEVKRVVAEAAIIAAESFNAIERMPVAQEDAQPAEQLRVLVIDNDEATVLAVTDILQNRAKVIWASNEQDAVNTLMQQDISVVVTDLTLGGKKISYLLKTMKQFNPSTQILVLTSTKDSPTLIKLINEAQIGHYLSKPLSRTLLVSNLEYLIQHFNLLCRVPALQNRQQVVPISDPKEQAQSSGLMGLLNRIRPRLQSVGL
jgi:serine/threonine-protein kinase